ncbi:hypothetical protein [Clostridium sp.]|uniref:hypothetical protein n=1 Tax=Clostridium sp. TaxID=1506 RepID=UPI003218037E
MANQKIIFSEDGTIETIDNYVLSKDEEGSSNQVEEYVEDAYTYMDIEDILKIEVEKKKVNNKAKSHEKSLWTIVPMNYQVIVEHQVK